MGGSATAKSALLIASRRPSCCAMDHRSLSRWHPDTRASRAGCNGPARGAKVKAAEGTPDSLKLARVPV